MNKENKIKILDALDALSGVVVFFGKGKGASSKCGDCGYRFAEGSPHPAFCNTNNAIRSLQNIVPAYNDRKAWLEQ